MLNIIIMDNKTSKKSWHAIQVECDCETFETFVWDLEGEDLRAYAKLEELKDYYGKTCENCGKNYRFNIIKTK